MLQTTYNYASPLHDATTTLNPATIGIVTLRMNYNACQQSWLCRQFGNKTYSENEVGTILRLHYSNLSKTGYCTQYNQTVDRIATSSNMPREFVQTVLYEWYNALQDGAITDVGVFDCSATNAQWQPQPPPPITVHYTSTTNFVWGGLALAGVGVGAWYWYKKRGGRNGKTK